MAKTNTPKRPTLGTTHEGAPADMMSAEQELRRSVLACMLWENTFYEQGEDIVERITRLVEKVPPEIVNDIAIEARTSGKLRHAPLWLCVGLARHSGLKAGTLASVIQRADELSEFLAMYWKDGKQPIAAQAKKGLAIAFRKFDAYQLAKYDRANAVRLKDVLFLTHAKPQDAEQAALWAQLVDGTLPSPDTWEVALSAGGDKKEEFTRLLTEKRLGYMALLRNLRNMAQAGVDEDLIFNALQEGAGRNKALPFRFIAAARAVPQWEAQIEPAMLESAPKAMLKGKTIVLVDVSGSMQWQMSRKSQLNAEDSASGVAILAREMCEKVGIATFSNEVVAVPPRRGFALRDAIRDSQPHTGTMLGRAVQTMNSEDYDRLIVITDEQSHDRVPGPKGKGYLINVGSYQRGVSYGPWTHIDGFSEAVLAYIAELENMEDGQKAS